MTHLVEIKIDTAKLYAWAKDISISAADEGYIIHSVLCAVYGQARPKPFVVVGTNRGVTRILGYSSISAEEMQEIREASANPTESSIIVSTVSKKMPDAWKEGAQFAFEVRVAPTRREKASGKHKDAYLFGEHGLSRDEIYSAWLTCKMEGAAVIQDLSMEEFSLRQVRRRGDSGDGVRKLQNRLTLPDVKFSGKLRIKNGEEFQRILTSGIGKNSAFGFGALMLRPI